MKPFIVFTKPPLDAVAVLKSDSGPTFTAVDGHNAEGRPGHVFSIEGHQDGWGAELTLTRAGFAPTVQRGRLWVSRPGTYAEFDVDDITLNPSRLPVDLLKIRGAMWTARAPIPFGPRPNQPDNILAMDYYETYDAANRKIMLDIYAGQHHYTHAVTGPLVDPGGYHGQYPSSPTVPTQAEFDAYLDGLEEWEQRGVVAIHFCSPDGWTLDQMKQLEPLFLQPRAQRLFRLVVPRGWEPALESDNASWVAWLQWGERVFPTAKRLIHMVADHDAPHWDAGMDNATAWANVVPYIHGWPVQNAGYAVKGGPIASPEFVSNFTAQFDENAGSNSLTSRFRKGYAGWPTTSANGGPLKVYAGEFAAYGDYWDNYPESEAIRLGNLALDAGADGSLDGCTVNVPQ